MLARAYIPYFETLAKPLVPFSLEQVTDSATIIPGTFLDFRYDMVLILDVGESVQLQ